jgi:hypothetical protein
MAIVLSFLAGPLVAQTMPAKQPNLVDIAREVEKPGHFLAHEMSEGRWAELNRTTGFPYAYLALVAASGTPEVWFVTGLDSFDAWGKSVGFGADNASYGQALAKIAQDDGDHLTNVIRMQARALPDASHGTFPEMGKVRVYSVLTVRMRPGFEQSFTEIAKHYVALAGAGSGIAGWRSYEVISGAPGGTYLVFSSHPSWAAVDANEAAFAKAMAAGAMHMEAAGKLAKEGIMSTEARYFTVNPTMSVMPKEMMASDPFWAPKKPTP